MPTLPGRTGRGTMCKISEETPSPRIDSSEAEFAKKDYVDMALHSLAQEVHSAAHFTQWSSLNIPHSVAHFLQIVAQSLQRSLENSESEDMKQAASLQMLAHAFNVLMHLTRA